MEVLETSSAEDAEERGEGGEEQKIKICKMVGQWGIPVVFLVFSGVYWALGTAKYFLG